METPQEKLRRDVDELFAESDRTTFDIMSRILIEALKLESEQWINEDLPL